jgi:hypothetical protein
MYKHKHYSAYSQNTCARCKQSSVAKKKRPETLSLKAVTQTTHQYHIFGLREACNTDFITIINTSSAPSTRDKIEK